MTCVKCGKEFPVSVVIDGKRRNLQNRKYCLECSPHNKHNTKKIHDTNKIENLSEKKCPKCNQVKSISNFYKTKDKIQSYCKSCHNSFCIERWKNKKIECVKAKGGVCSRCGYANNYAALDFHHLRDKDPDWNLRRFSAERLKKELEKCILLCSNCHAEIHNPQCNTTTMRPKSIKETIKIFTICENCGKEFIGNKYCSKPCADQARRKVKIRPSLIELKNLLEKESYCAVARRYAVSDKAVRKWAIHYGLT